MKFRPVYVTKKVLTSRNSTVLIPLDDEQTVKKKRSQPYQSNKNALGQIVICSRPLIHNMYRKLASKLNKKNVCFFSLWLVSMENDVFVHQMYFYYMALLLTTHSLCLSIYISISISYISPSPSLFSLYLSLFIILFVEWGHCLYASKVELTRICQMHTHTFSFRLGSRFKFTIYKTYIRYLCANRY